MEKWKSFFQSSGSDIWTVIDRAITIAAVEHPAEMKMKRDKLTEKMFCPTTHLTGLCDCDEEDGEGENGNNGGGSDDDDDVSENKFVISAAKAQDEEVDEEEEDEEMEVEDRKSRKGSSYFDVEALSDEMEEESRRIREINRLKNRISDSVEEEEDYLCEALERLESMQISFETLKATEIGKPVNNLRKHPSARVRSIVKRLVKAWKALADQWSKSAEHLAAGSNLDNNDDDEYGLPSPPVDEGELLAAGSGPVEVTKLFNFIEDDMSTGSGDMNEQPRRRSSGDWVNGIYEDAHSPDNNVLTSKASRGESDRPSKLSAASYKRDGVAKITNATSMQRCTAGDVRGDKEKPGLSGRYSEQKDDNTNNRQRGVATISSRPKPVTSSGGGVSRPKPMPNGSLKKSDDRSQVAAKQSVTSKPEQEMSALRLAAAKRKLHEGYRQAENAKKQRTVQVMDLTELPKGKGGPKAIKAGPTKSHVQHNNRYNARR